MLFVDLFGFGSAVRLRNWRGREERVWGWRSVGGFCFEVGIILFGSSFFKGCFFV